MTVKIITNVQYLYYGPILSVALFASTLLGYVKNKRNIVIQLSTLFVTLFTIITIK